MYYMGRRDNVDKAVVWAKGVHLGNKAGPSEQRRSRRIVAPRPTNEDGRRDVRVRNSHVLESPLRPDGRARAPRGGCEARPRVLGPILARPRGRSE